MQSSKRPDSEWQRPRVAIAEWPSMDDLDQVLGHVLDLMGGLERYVGPGQHVLVKPNLVAGGPPSSGGTTHVELVEALVRRLQRLEPGRLVVAEGAAVADPQGTFALLGYADMAARTGIELIDLDRAPHIPVPLADPVYPGVLEVAQPILECDTLISVPCLKTHYCAGITVAIKNAFGTVSQETRTRMHREYRLEECILDLNRIRSPDLFIVDGLIGSQGLAGGRDFIHAADAHLMLAADNPVALDAVAVRLMQQNPNIRYIQWGAEKGLGPAHLVEIDIVGLSLEAAQRDYLTPAEQLTRSMGNVRLLDLDSCTGCRSVVEMALGRYEAMRLAHPLTVVMGGSHEEATLEEPAPGEELLVVGDCAAKLRHRGTFIPGCPLDASTLHSYLREASLICQRCAPVVQAALAEVAAGPFSRRLRVMAGAEEAYRGPDNSARPSDLTLVVGDCMRHYYHNSRLRADQVLGGGEGDNVVLVEGCPPAEDGMRDALRCLAGVDARRASAG